MDTVKLHAPNISCQHCIMTIRRELSQVEGVVSVEGDPATKDVVVTFQAPATLETIKDVMAEIGYPVQ